MCRFLHQCPYLTQKNISIRFKFIYDSEINVTQKAFFDNERENQKIINNILAQCLN